ncbi:Uncharacterised protein [Helicobacter pametensis]|nr:Uncharacterised protein [Helicobacter pametensis]
MILKIENESPSPTDIFWVKLIFLSASLSFSFEDRFAILGFIEKYKLKKTHIKLKKPAHSSTSPYSTHQKC